MADMDGLNSVPDEVLRMILSYLPIKEAVRAQLVSKRWMNMWVDIPVLNFNFAEFRLEDVFTNVHSECNKNFVMVIDDALNSRQIQQIDKFILCWPYQVKFYNYHEHPVRRWIDHVLEHSPRLLSIYVQPIIANVSVPDTAFACPTLVDLRVYIDGRKPEVLETSMINLPRLRKLNLGFYTINADFLSKLQPGCPSLQLLELYACRLNPSYISFNGLKSLVINGCNSTDIKVSIPSLQYLKVTMLSCQTAGIVFQNMSSLIRACVCFLTAGKHERSFYNSEANILNGLSGVMSLEVLLHGSEAKGMLNHVLKDCPAFNNLKAMLFESFEGCLLDCVDMIDRLVQHSAILEHLSYYLCKDGSDKIELSKELCKIKNKHGKCHSVERDQAQIFDSLDKLTNQLNWYMDCFEKMEMEMEYKAENLGEDDNNNGNGIDGIALWQEEEGGKGEAGLAEEEEELEEMENRDEKRRKA